MQAAAPPREDAPVEEPVPTHTAASWLLAIMPLWVIVITALLAATDASAAAIFLALAATLTLLNPIGLALTLWDIATLRRRGSSLSMAHALWVLLGVYLIARAILLKGKDRERWVLVGVNLVAGLVAMVALGGSVVTIVTDEDVRRAFLYNESFTEREIATTHFAQTGQRINVDCPNEPPIASGETFECEMTKPSGRIVWIATVTWENNFGMYSWTIREGTSPLLDQA
jgi:hypothetical protein